MTFMTKPDTPLAGVSRFPAVAAICALVGLTACGGGGGGGIPLIPLTGGNLSQEFAAGLTSEADGTANSMHNSIPAYIGGGRNIPYYSIETLSGSWTTRGGGSVKAVWPDGGDLQLTVGDAGSVGSPLGSLELPDPDERSPSVDDREWSTLTADGRVGRFNAYYGEHTQLRRTIVSGRTVNLPTHTSHVFVLTDMEEGAGLDYVMFGFWMHEKGEDEENRIVAAPFLGGGTWVETTLFADRSLGVDSFDEDADANYSGEVIGVHTTKTSSGSVDRFDANVFTANVDLFVDFHVEAGDLSGTISEIVSGGRAIDGEIILDETDLHGDVIGAYARESTVSGMIEGDAIGTGSWETQFFGYGDKWRVSAEIPDPLPAPDVLAGTFAATTTGNTHHFIGAFAADVEVE